MHSGQRLPIPYFIFTICLAQATALSYALCKYTTDTGTRVIKYRVLSACIECARAWHARKRANARINQRIDRSNQTHGGAFVNINRVPQNSSNYEACPHYFGGAYGSENVSCICFGGTALRDNGIQWYTIEIDINRTWTVQVMCV